MRSGSWLVTNPVGWVAVGPQESCAHGEGSEVSACRMHPFSLAGYRTATDPTISACLPAGGEVEDSQHTAVHSRDALEEMADRLAHPQAAAPKPAA